MKEPFNIFDDFVPKGEKSKAGAETPELERDEVEEGKALAVLAYIPILCFIPYFQGRNNKFVFEHAKQGIILFLFEVIALLGALFWKAALFLAAVASLVGVVIVLQGRLWRIPFIGVLAERLQSEAETKPEEVE